MWAIGYWVPSRAEQLAGRDWDDPDVTDWRKPHLTFGPCLDSELTYPRSAMSGKDVTVTVANLSQGASRVRAISPKGVTPPVSPVLTTVPILTEINDLYTAGQQGNFFLRTTASDTIHAYVGESFLVETGGGHCVGTYTVTKSAAWQLAEIHGHRAGTDNDGILER